MANVESDLLWTRRLLRVRARCYESEDRCEHSEERAAHGETRVRGLGTPSDRPGWTITMEPAEAPRQGTSAPHQERRVISLNNNWFDHPLIEG